VSAIGSIATAILARPVIGSCRERREPRKTYSALLIVGALPGTAIGRARDIEIFFRRLIGLPGAAFVW
jgi:NNP family nitrate/nitrite transporter-like MFS transporter